LIRTAYTIGHTLSYDEGLASKGLKKKGAYGPTPSKPDGYAGGWCWLTFNEADAFRRNCLCEFDRVAGDFSVYELELPNGWGQDTRPGDGCYHLLVDAVIIRKVT
jgi:hypothetical protein